MDEKTKILIHRIYSTVLAVLLIAVGICYIASAIDVFSSENISRLESEGALTGEVIRAEIGAALRRLLIPSLLLVAFIIGTPFINHFLPLPEQKLKVTPDEERTLNIAKRRAEGALYAPSAYEGIMRQRRLRLIFTLAGVGLFALSMIYPLIRIFSSETFTALGNANKEVMSASVVLLVFLIPTAVYSVAVGIFFRISRRCETELLRQSADAGTPLPSPTRTEVWVKKNAALISKILITTVCTLSLVFIILGIINGGMADVLDKAAKICRECIGLG